MNPGELLADRYRVIRELGRSPAGGTYLAADTDTGRAVAVRVLHLGRVGDWKIVELFEREASVLKSLRHARIPAYVDSFQSDLGGDLRFVLVREYVDGIDLQEMVDDGWRGTEEQVREIGRQLVEIVSYIHSLRPPVVHRDITPRNVIARPDGGIFLVDFGGAHDAVRLSGRDAPTMVGTPGYAPLEQFVGRASVRSDLYGIAATLVFLLTRRNPADLPTRALKVDLASVIDIRSPGLARVLSSWMEPDETARTLSEEEAAALLAQAAETSPPWAQSGASAQSGGWAQSGASAQSGGWAQTAGKAGAAVTAAAPLFPRPPSGSRILYTPSGDEATYILPVGGRSGGRRMGTFGLAWLFFVGFWTYSAVRMRAPAGFLFFAVPFLAVGAGVLGRALTSLFGRRELRIEHGGVSTLTRFLFASRRRGVPLEDAGECRTDGGLSLDVGARTLRLGDGLSAREREWLRDSINDHLRRLRGAAPPTAAPGRRGAP